MPKNTKINNLLTFSKLMVFTGLLSLDKMQYKIFSICLVFLYILTAEYVFSYYFGLPVYVLGFCEKAFFVN